MSLERSSTGVLGGTFNPIHLGHLRAAEEVREQLDLARVIFVPSADPPLKRESELCVAPAETRLAWVRLAVADNPCFEVDPLELGREGPSYSVDTLRVLGERLAPERPVFVIGDDAFAELASWRDPAALLELAHFAVIERPGPPADRAAGAPAAAPAAWLPEALREDYEPVDEAGALVHRRAGTWIRRLAIAGLEVSSTDVRRRLGEGRSVRYLLPEGVWRAVVASGVYASRPRSR